MAAAAMCVPSTIDCVASAASTSTARTSSCLTKATTTRSADEIHGHGSACTTLFSGADLTFRSPQRAFTGWRRSRQQEMLITAAAHRKANLCVRKKETVPLPTLTDPSGMPQHLSCFLQQPAGTQSMLNIKALQKYEYLGEDVFRCYLPKVALLSFEVAPIVDLFVAASDADCRVEMRSCTFSGSKAVEDQNNRFSASLRNHLTWQDTPEGDQVLDLDTELRVSLEVYTPPFTMLPLSAVEVPGNAIMQAMLDRLIPLFLDHLFVDYKRWVDEEALGLQLNTITLSEALRSPNPTAPERRPVEVSS